MITSDRGDWKMNEGVEEPFEAREVAWIHLHWVIGGVDSGIT